MDLYKETNTVGVLKRTVLLINPKIRFALLYAYSHCLATFKQPSLDVFKARVLEALQA